MASVFGFFLNTVHLFTKSWRNAWLFTGRYASTSLTGTSQCPSIEAMRAMIQMVSQSAGVFFLLSVIGIFSGSISCSISFIHSNMFKTCLSWLSPSTVFINVYDLSLRTFARSSLDIYDSNMSLNTLYSEQIR